MARSRILKPGFFSNEILIELDPWIRLLFAGLWLIADREGRLEDRPRRIKMQLFPADSFDVEEGLTQLCDAGFLLRYEIGGQRYLEICNFLKHQSIHRNESISIIPGPDGDIKLPESCEDHDVQLQTCPDNVAASTSDISSVSNQTSEEREPQKTGAPEKLALTDDLKKWAKDTLGVVATDTWLLRESEKFLDYHRARGTKLFDWEAARRKWLCNGLDFLRTPVSLLPDIQKAIPKKPFWQRVLEASSVRLYDGRIFCGSDLRCTRKLDNIARFEDGGGTAINQADIEFLEGCP